MVFKNLSKFNEKELEAYLKALDASTILSLSDTLGNIIQVNEKFEKVFGAKQKHIAGKNYNHFNSGYHPKEFFAEMWKKILKKEIWVGDICNKNSFGEILWFTTTIVPVLDEVGEIIQFITIRQDVTELKTQQEENWKQLQFQASINKSTNNMIIRTDLAGTILYVNSAFERITSYDADDVINEKAPTFFIEKNNLEKRMLDLNKQFQIDLSTDLQVLFYKTQKGLKNEQDWNIICKNNTKRVIKFTISYLLDQEQVPIGYIFIGNDITEERLLEDTLKQSKIELEKTLHLKNQFLARLSHEIKTPLNGILGMVELLETTTINSEQKDYLESIQKSSYRLLTLINKTVEFNKVENENFDINEKSFSMTNELISLKKTYEPLCVAKKNKFLITNNLSNDYFYGDEKRVFQAVSFIIENSIKYTNDGIISLTIDKNENDENSVKFEIQDTGCGIDANMEKYIFNPFIYENVIKNEDYNGLGLSLAIASKIVSRLKGEIGYRNNLEKGASFWIKLPLKYISTLEEKIQHPLISNIDYGNLKVLIVEDDLINQRLLRKMLNRFNLFPEVASNGLEALELIIEKKFDIIFMDINMPVMDGIEATRKIREKQNIYGTPYIIAVTANSVTGDQEVCLSAGMDEYISKPVKRETLQMMLNKVIGDEVTEARIEIPEITTKFYIGKILEDFKDDEEILQDFILKLINEIPNKVGILEVAIKENNFDTIKIESIHLQNLIGNVHQEEIQRTLEFFEKYGQNRKIRNILPMFLELKKDLFILIDELEKQFIKKAV